MKKIGFNEHYGLQTAVYNGTKTKTRCTEKCLDRLYAAEKELGEPLEIYQQEITREGIMLRTNAGILSLHTRYKIDEVVAVAQSYKSIHEEMMNGDYGNSRYDAYRCAMVAGTKGWNNKMFVRADLMPHQIRITGIKVERLQDISEEDVYREGFRHEFVNNGWGNAAYHEEAILVYYDNIGRTKQIRDKDPKEAFSFLIDKISGNGTWERNPYVFAYTFELLK